jgi:hypothetical protein
LRFRPAWEQEQLAERHEVLALYDSFCTTQKQLLLVLLELNRLYYPGWRWIGRLMDEMGETPPNLSPRLKQLFSIVSIDPLASVYQFPDLIEETFRLVETHLGEVDTHAAHERFRGQRRVGKRAPEAWSSWPGIQPPLFFSNRDRRCEDGRQKRLPNRKTSGWTQRPSRPRLGCRAPCEVS